jgi:phosphoglucosamine mutase
VSRKYFGTDGIRGKVGSSPITPDFVLRLGFAAGTVLAQTSHDPADREHPAVIIGKDTRISGYMLESALESGLCAAGVDVLLVGPMPTPAIAYLTRALRLQAGVMISASHNPYDDNGIKFFSAQGTKLPDEVEAAIEQKLDEPLQTKPSAQLGRVRRIEDADGRYIEFCKSSFPNELDLRGMKLVVDCAHGATYHIAPPVFHELGAEVIAIGNKPNGLNINDEVGSTHISTLQQAVREQRADFGIALDGDGDRLMMCDADGTVFDGDQLLYVIAKHRRETGACKGGVVGTLMTNLAFEHALAKLDIPFARAKVGDRYVLEMLLEKGWYWGGENSGHIICKDKHSTGDGIISALQVLTALRMNKTSIARYTQELTLYPQVLINVPTARGFKHTEHASVGAVVQAAEHELRGSGRVLLRPSGTEPVLRVMVEGQNETQVRACAERISAAVRAAAAESARG